MSELPTGTVTFLFTDIDFTDIDRSTRLQQLRDRYDALLEGHYRVRGGLQRLPGA